MSAVNLVSIASCIAGSSFANLITTESDGSLWPSTIHAPYLDCDGYLWFFVQNHAFVAANIEANPELLVICQSHKPNISTSLSGSGYVVTNLAMKQDLWAKAGWPDEIDPLSRETTLVRVTICRADFWDSTSKTVVRHTARTKDPFYRPVPSRVHAEPALSHAISSR